MEIIPNWHPLLVHFTVALYAVSALLFAAGYFTAASEWRKTLTGAAYINLWLGAGVTVFTVAAGIYAYNTVGHDAPSHLAMTDHRNWALVTAAVFWIIAIWSVFIYRSGKSASLPFVIIMLFGASLLGLTGFKGGEIVYRYGLGVMSLPKVAGEGHSHNHENDAAHGQDEATSPNYDAPASDGGHDEHEHNHNH